MPTLELQKTTRRKVLLGTLAGLASGLMPQLSEASRLETINHFDPARTISGLIFDEIRAVTIEPAADVVISTLVDGKKFQHLKNRLSFCSLRHCQYVPIRHPQHDNRKAALIVLGAAGGYRAHKERQRQRQLEILLHDNAQMQRFDAALKYLIDNHIEVQLADMGWAEVLKADTTPDQLMMIEKPLSAGRDQLRHLAKLIEKTGVKVFDQWLV